MSTGVRNRIKAHVRVRAGDLVPHELNPRVHPDAQRDALRALLDEVGFARSLLAYELPDGRLKLIDGHLRRDLEPDLEVDVEVLDVSDAEARALLLSMDPLAALASYDQPVLDELRSLAETSSAAVEEFWRSLGTPGQPLSLPDHEPSPPSLPEQFLVLIECASEEEQARLLERLRAEGLTCRALLS